MYHRAKIRAEHLQRNHIVEIAECDLFHVQAISWCDKRKVTRIWGGGRQFLFFYDQMITIVTQPE